jgi:glycosyltransferase involved in cell wall biosynthesis
MKIFVIGPTYPYRGGISHYNTLLCDALSKKHQVTPISFKRMYPKIFFPGKDQRDTKSQQKIIHSANELIDTLNPITWLKTFLKIRKEKPDLLVMYWWTPFFMPIFTFISFLVRHLTKTKVLFLCHNVLPHDKTFFDKALTKPVLTNSDYFIVHSQEDKNNLLNMIPKANVKVTVHPTYDVFAKEQNVLDLNDLNLKKNVILFFGFVRPYKGLMHLIKSMPSILKEVDLDLLIVGEFWKDKSDYIQKKTRLDIIDRVKIVDNYVPNESTGNYFNKSDVVVLPYNSATNSGIIQMAFGFNKPVIVTNVGGLPEVVEDNKTGFVVRPRDPEELAKSIIRFYKENKKEEFIDNIKKEKDKFSWDKVVDIIEDFQTH